MRQVQKPRPTVVIGPLGELLTLETLPPASTKGGWPGARRRWSRPYMAACCQLMRRANAINWSSRNSLAGNAQSNGLECQRSWWRSRDAFAICGSASNISKLGSRHPTGSIRKRQQAR